MSQSYQTSSTSIASRLSRDRCRTKESVKVSISPVTDGISKWKGRSPFSHMISQLENVLFPLASFTSFFSIVLGKYSMLFHRIVFETFLHRRNLGFVRQFKQQVATAFHLMIVCFLVCWKKWGLKRKDFNSITISSCFNAELTPALLETEIILSSAFCCICLNFGFFIIVPIFYAKKVIMFFFQVQISQFLGTI